MKKSFQIGAAFIGVIVGAGFASGQEVLQFFTSFGVMGIVGAFIATVFGAVAFASSFFGFVTLVGTVYPIMGYLGFVLIAAIIFAWFRGNKSVKAKELTSC